MLASEDFFYHFVWIMSIAITLGLVVLLWMYSKSSKHQEQQQIVPEVALQDNKVESNVLVFHVHKIHPNVSNLK